VFFLGKHFSDSRAVEEPFPREPEHASLAEVRPEPTRLRGYLAHVSPDRLAPSANLPCAPTGVPGVFPGTIPGTAPTVPPEHYRQVRRRALSPVRHGSTRTVFSAPNPAVPPHASLRATRDLDAGSAVTATIEAKTWPMPTPNSTRRARVTKGVPGTHRRLFGLVPLAS
jgi:hypothetical protein